MAIPQKLKIGLSCDPSIPLLVLCSKELKAVIHTDVCTLFIAESFRIAEI